MARYRTLDGNLWKHRDIRRAPLQVGWLYAYLITAEADDEGRFVAEAWRLAEDAFSSAHGVGEEESEAALRYLSEAGLLLMYEVDGTRYGFLSGWFEHQYIQRDRRESSSLPPPPCAVPTWEEADRVRDECAKERGFDLRKITYQEALRWHRQRGYQADNERITGGQLTVNLGITDGQPKGRIGYPTVNLIGYPEVEGEEEKEVEKEEEGKNGLLSAPADPSPDPAPDPTPEPSSAEKLATLRDGIPHQDLDLIDEYLDNAANENESKRITPGRRVNETRDLLELREELGIDAWRYGMAAANRKCAPNTNYVKKAAGSWQPGMPTQGRTGYASRGMKPVSNWERRAQEEAAR